MTSPSPSDHAHLEQDSPQKTSPKWRRNAGRLLAAAFFAAVIALLVSQLRDVEWELVGSSIRAYPWSTLVSCGALVITGYLFYGSYDVLGRHYTQHGLSRLQSLGIACVSYAFNLSLGPLIGGAGFRFRLYSRFGLDNATIGRLLAFSIVTNWLGYMLLAGALFVSGAVRLPASWLLGGAVLPVVGFAMLAMVAAYVLQCAWHPGRTLRIQRVEMELPSIFGWPCFSSPLRRAAGSRSARFSTCC